MFLFCFPLDLLQRFGGIQVMVHIYLLFPSFLTVDLSKMGQENRGKRNKEMGSTTWVRPSVITLTVEK